MIEKLSQKQKRILMVGAAGAIAIVLIVFGTRWLERWGKTRESLASIRAKLELVNADEAKQAGVLSIVPVFEMPKAEAEQELLFRDKLNEQLKKAGIRSEPLQVLPSPSRQSQYKLLRLKCNAKCRFGQVLDLLAALRENPYLAGIEEMRVQCDTKQPAGQRQEVELNLTVSTFVK
ncbi:MAG: GspMb/PilO family protein [Sedimentisphaerales bacterium]|jgi:hypothetical protein|nr:GspMb/PilO family protein [Sedimentisphaerales bacterium]